MQNLKQRMDYDFMSLFFIFIVILLHHTKPKRQPLEKFYKNGILKKFPKYVQRNTCVGVFLIMFYAGGQQLC